MRRYSFIAFISLFGAQFLAESNIYDHTIPRTPFLGNFNWPEKDCFGMIARDKRLDCLSRICQISNNFQPDPKHCSETKATFAVYLQRRSDLFIKV